MDLKDNHAISTVHLLAIGMICSVFGVVICAAVSLASGGQKTTTTNKTKTVQIYCSPNVENTEVDGIRFEQTVRCRDTETGRYIKCPEVWNQDQSSPSPSL